MKWRFQGTKLNWMFGFLAGTAKFILMRLYLAFSAQVSQVLSLYLRLGIIDGFKKTNFDATLRGMKKYFQKLYHYNAWANKRVLDILNRQKVKDEQILSLMGHIVAAQYLWFHRINGLPAPDVKLWGDYQLHQLTSSAEQIGQQWIQFVESTDNFDRQLTYKNYTGDPYTNNVEMIMIHLVNHSSYHRAQIALLLRQKGFEPINTDFITYDRVMTGQMTE